MRAIRVMSLLLPVAALVGCGNESSGNAAQAVQPAASKTASATTSAAAAAPARDWVAVVEKTPEGGFRIGNPDAEVKLLEFASLTCPHCRDFHAQAMAPLKKDYIASGKVSYELRNFVLNPADFAATLLVRCQGPGPYYKLVDSFFETQSSWIEPFTKFTEEDQKRLNAIPAEQRIVTYADEGGLDELMKARGMSKARFEQCLMDPAAAAELDRIRTDAVTTYKVTGTPSFVINGKKQDDVYGWEALRPKLDAALN